MDKALFCSHESRSSSLHLLVAWGYHFYVRNIWAAANAILLPGR